jgi:hypothetical protein
MSFHMIHKGLQRLKRNTVKPIVAPKKKKPVKKASAKKKITKK